MIRWLHISDLHMGDEKDADCQNFCNSLLKACIEQRIQADFVVATGDFHNVWDTGNYNASKSFLCQLIKALGLDIDKDLFIIPGNHDVEKGKHTEVVQKFFTLVKSNATKRLPLETHLDQDCNSVQRDTYKKTK